MVLYGSPLLLQLVNGVGLSGSLHQPLFPNGLHEQARFHESCRWFLGVDAVSTVEISP
jgi:hypothetical protein